MFLNLLLKHNGQHQFRQARFKKPMTHIIIRSNTSHAGFHKFRHDSKIILECSINYNRKLRLYNQRLRL